MGETQFQKFIFTLMMCFCMVLGMTIYNMLLNEGWSNQFCVHLLKDFWLGFFVALFLDIFVIGKIAKAIVFKIIVPTKDTKRIFIILSISCCMVIGMVLCMSLYGSVTVMGFSFMTIKSYPSFIARNIVVALPLNLLIVSPFVRIVFSKAFPVKLAV